MKNKLMGTVILCVCMPITAHAETAPPDWWQQTKEGAQQAWQSTTETVSQWATQAKESEAMQTLKQGATNTVETLTDRQTYLDAWSETQKATSEAVDTVGEAFNQVREQNVHDKTELEQP
ncbi:MAG: hypothetical protein JXR44_05365 [Thiotrichales bacterium]|nr:hypothetical protein [Thiotrichales bacterium]